MRWNFYTLWSTRATVSDTFIDMSVHSTSLACCGKYLKLQQERIPPPRLSPFWPMPWGVVTLKTWPRKISNARQRLTTWPTPPLSRNFGTTFMQMWRELELLDPPWMGLRREWKVSRLLCRDYTNSWWDLRRGFSFTVRRMQQWGRWVLSWMLYPSGLWGHYQQVLWSVLLSEIIIWCLTLTELWNLWVFTIYTMQAWPEMAMSISAQVRFI